jgi:hypothetical protein
VASASIRNKAAINATILGIYTPETKIITIQESN